MVLCSLSFNLLSDAVNTIETATRGPANQFLLDEKKMIDKLLEGTRGWRCLHRAVQIIDEQMDENAAELML